MADPRRNMKAPSMSAQAEKGFGDILYWAATIIAALIAAWDFATFLDGASRGRPILGVMALVFAAIIWLLGWACRHVRA